MGAAISGRMTKLGQGGPLDLADPLSGQIERAGRPPRGSAGRRDRGRSAAGGSDARARRGRRAACRPHPPAWPRPPGRRATRPTCPPRCRPARCRLRLPIGVSRLTGSDPYRSSSPTWASGICSARPARPDVGTRPSSPSIWPRRPQQPADLVAGVDRKPDRTGRVVDAPPDGLADPPGGVGGELEALAPVKLLDGVDQARGCPPGSGRAGACRRTGTSWRSRPPGAGWR